MPKDVGEPIPKRQAPPEKVAAQERAREERKRRDEADRQARAKALEERLRAHGAGAATKRSPSHELQEPARAVRKSALEAHKPVAVHPRLSAHEKRMAEAYASDEVPEDLKEFATLVATSARSLVKQAGPAASGDKKWSGIVHGRYKVFVSALHDEMVRRVETRAQLPGFKEKLLKAHLAGLLELTRADLVEHMPAKAVAESLITHRDSTFHFVRVG
ncbi:hypothetical protein [Chondromyces apiculatus]|nr:hypothetical protein [Chondromyces apiculatus]